MYNTLFSDVVFKPIVCCYILGFDTEIGKKMEK